MPTIEEILISKAEVSASSPKGGLVHSFPEYGTLDAKCVMGPKIGLCLTTLNDKSAVHFALLKLVNAFNFAITKGTKVSTINRPSGTGFELGFSYLGGWDEPLTVNKGQLTYQVKRHNNLVVGKNGKIKRRTVVKFFLPLVDKGKGIDKDWNYDYALESACFLGALRSLKQNETNGHILVVVPGEQEPVCAIYENDTQLTVSVEI